MVERNGTDLDNTLAERKTQHGPFSSHSVIECELRSILERHGSKLGHSQKVAVGMIMHKLARIMNGGHRHSDTWHDIAGYAELIRRELLDE